MSVYRVLVSHSGYRTKSVVEFEPTQQVQYLVDAGYLKLIEEVSCVDGTASSSESAGLGSGDVDPGPSPLDVPRKRRNARKTEVTDEPDRAVSDAGPADGEEQGA